jgi:hypothetical protein
VAKGYIRQIVKELKRQRRQIDKAIAALGEIEQKKISADTVRARKQQTQPTHPIEQKNGTTGQVIPFIRPI